MGIDEAGHEVEHRLGLGLGQRREQAARHCAGLHRELRAQHLARRREDVGIGAPVLRVGAAGDEAARLQRRERLAGRGRVDAYRRRQPVAVHPRRGLDLRDQRDVPDGKVEAGMRLALKGVGDLP